MNILFLMDDLDQIDCQKDTTFMLMFGAHNRGHRTFYLPKGGIIYQNGQFFFRATQVIARIASKSFLIKEEVFLTQEEVHAIFVRTDPPFDDHYLFNTWMLDRLTEKMIIVNHPSGIRTANEKLWALQFKDLIPNTLVTRHKIDFTSFLSKEKTIIAKPINGYGGASIFKVDHNDSNSSVIYETLTQNGSKEAIFQQYIPDAENGDKRVLLLNGNPLGAVNRVHSGKDHRNNIFAGGKTEKTSLSARDLEIIKALKPKLLSLGLFFVGIDIIGNYLIEVNVTSPTCLQEMNEIYQQNLEDAIIEKLETMIQSKQEERQNHQLFKQREKTS